MRPELADLQAIFQDGYQYCVPVFQRQYVWQEQEQWAPLWEDICDTADSCLEHASTDDEASTHFLGVIVLSQISSAIREPDRREIIDGQQRLITLQLILSATLGIVEQLQTCDERHPLKTLLTNYAADAHSSNPLKVVPSAPDRKAFETAITTRTRIAEDEQSSISQAWQHFHHEIEDWSKHDGPEDEKRLYRLSVLTEALRKRLKFVVLNLEDGDNPQAIFESMNARGAMLQAADLIKNRLLLGDDRQGTSAMALYDEYWADFDTDYWLEQPLIGRKNSSAIDSCLFYWLQLKSSKKFPYSRTYLEFEKILEDDELGVKGMLVDINRAAQLYRHLATVPDERTRGVPDATFRYRMMVVEAASVMPLLLWLYQKFALTSRQSLDPELLTILTAIESFLVRGMICRVNKRPLSNFCFRVLSELQSLPSRQASGYVDHLHRALLESNPRTNLRWPTDQEVVQSVVYEPKHTPLKTQRLRLILEALEDHLRGDGDKVEEPCRRDLTVEHIMPVKWREVSWPLRDSTAISRELEGLGLPEDLGSVSDLRNGLVHSLGNLTLARQKLNSSMSNRPWSEKRDALRRHSVLRLGEEVTGCDAWDEVAIVRRAKRLAGLICEIWPRPQDAEA